MINTINIRILKSLQFRNLKVFPFISLMSLFVASSLALKVREFNGISNMVLILSKGMKNCFKGLMEMG